MQLWVEEIYHESVKAGWKVKETLYHAESPYQVIDIVDTEYFGRMLLLDGLVMTTEKDEFVYHDMISHIPMLAHPNPKKVLVIGGGDGGTVREVLKHPSVERVVLCEIDGLVIDSCRKFLPSIADALGDPRVDIQVGDGAAYIASHKNAFDVILVDSTDPVGPGERLFNHQFYTHVLEALTEHGVMAAQSESAIAQPKEVTVVNDLMNGVFPITKTYTATIPTYPGSQWTWTFCSKNTEPFDFYNASRVEALEKTCKYFNKDVHRAVFALPNYVRALIQPKSVLSQPFGEFKGKELQPGELQKC